MNWCFVVLRSEWCDGEHVLDRLVIRLRTPCNTSQRDTKRLLLANFAIFSHKIVFAQGAKRDLHIRIGPSAPVEPFQCAQKNDLSLSLSRFACGELSSRSV